MREVHPGEKVRIPVWTNENMPWWCVPDMEQYFGQTLTVNEVWDDDGDRRCNFVEDDCQFFWVVSDLREEDEFGFQVGDVVYVPEFSSIDRPDWALPSMDKLSGRTYTISRIINEYADADLMFCKFAEDPGQWLWGLDWLILEAASGMDFEPATEEELCEFLGFVPAK